MTQNDDPLPKFPIWIKIVWTLTFLSLLTALILCLMALKKPKVEPLKIEYRQEPFVYGWSSPVMPHTEVLAVITAYNPVPEQTDDTPHITASGERVREGIVACPVWLEFGTIVEIDGKLYECADRMHPRYWYQNRFDILMWDYREAKKWGKQIKVVKIYH